MIVDEIIFKVIFVVVWSIYILIRAPFDKAYRSQRKIKILDTKIEKHLIMLLMTGLVLIPLIWVFTPFLESFTIEMPLWLRFLGLLICFISMYYFYLIHKTLGKNWSPALEILEGHRLIKTGVYKRIRHPMYLQILLWSIAQFFILSNAIAGLTGLLSWAIFYFIRVPKEEKMMTDYFGDEYIEYKRYTGSILPGINHGDLLN